MLARLLSTIPIALQREGLSLSVVQASLRGRWRGNAHPGEVGRALRSLGFKRRRKSDDTHGSRALWFPTGVSELNGRFAALGSVLDHPALDTPKPLASLHTAKGIC
jgi:hypothetical protein